MEKAQFIRFHRVQKIEKYINLNLPKFINIRPTNISDTSMPTPGQKIHIILVLSTSIVQIFQIAVLVK